MEQTRALRQRVLRPHETIAELAWHEPSQAFAAGVSQGDELVAVGLIGPEGQPGEWRIRGMATAPDFRGRGAGSAVLSALLARARAGGATAVWANVRTPARTLYERAGFRVSSDEFQLPKIGPHVVMRRQL